MFNEKQKTEFLKEEYTKAFIRKVEKKRNPSYEEIINIGMKNSEGNLWILGGFVYRLIIEEIYGRELRKGGVDIDFVAEELSERPYIPRGWKQRRSKYMNPYLVKKRHKIDLNDLPNFRTLATKEYIPTIENILERSQLNIQSVAWDCQKEILIGNEGILSIKNQLVKVNNLKEAEYEANIKGITLEEMVKRKAKELEFTSVFT